MTASRPVLTVVVVNFRTPKLTIDCLASVAAQRDRLKDKAVMRVQLVDNGSNDGSADQLAQWVAQQPNDWSVTFHRSPKNHGFSGGNNIGLRSDGRQSTEADFYLLLNSDTVLHPGCLEACLDALATDDTIGVLSCQLVEPDGTIQANARPFPTPARVVAASLGLPWRMPKGFGWAHPDDPGWDRATTTRDVDWVGGAFMMIRRSVIEKVGLLDESFFFYGEDVEFCYRVRQAGFHIRYIPTGKATHLGGGSSDVARLPRAEKNRHRWAARYLVQLKLYGLWAVELVWLLDVLIWQLRSWKKRWFDRDRAAANDTTEVCNILRDVAARNYNTRPVHRPSRWAFVLPGLGRISRGAETAFEALAVALAEECDCDVTLFGAGQAIDADARTVAFQQAPLAEHQLREHQQGRAAIPTLRSPEAREDLAFARVLKKFYRPEQYDITVTCNYPWSNWFLRWQRDRRTRLPRHLFITQNGDWPACSRQREFRFFGCDGLVCTNPVYYDRNKHRWPATLIANGFWPDRFYPPGERTPSERDTFGLPTDRPVVLIVSALMEHKRVLEGIEAVAALNEPFLFIAGDGPLRKAVQVRGEALMPGRFRLSQVEHERMGALYRSADVLLHPCLDEPSAHVYVEAMASGLPVVTHDWAVTQWTFGDLAVLVDARELPNMTHGLREALSGGLKQRLAAAYEDTCERFAWPALAKRLHRFGMETLGADAPVPKPREATVEAMQSQQEASEG